MQQRVKSAENFKAVAVKINQTLLTHSGENAGERGTVGSEIGGQTLPIEGNAKSFTAAAMFILSEKREKFFPQRGFGKHLDSVVHGQRAGGQHRDKAVKKLPA